MRQMTMKTQLQKIYGMQQKQFLAKWAFLKKQEKSQINTI